MSEVKFYQFEDKTIAAVLGKGSVPGGTLLVPGAVDAAQEKHVPAVTRDGNTVQVHIGSVTHPMVEKHYIEWIAAATEKTVQIHYLKPGEDPATVFTAEGEATVYAYCNLHGLWKATI